jgi:hypothetical protein
MEFSMGASGQDLIRQSLTKVGEFAAHPAAFGILLVYAILWFTFDPGTLTANGKEC